MQSTKSTKRDRVKKRNERERKKETEQTKGEINRRLGVDDIKSSATLISLELFPRLRHQLDLLICETNFRAPLKQYYVEGSCNCTALSRRRSDLRKLSFEDFYSRMYSAFYISSSKRVRSRIYTATNSDYFSPK